MINHALERDAGTGYMRYLGMYDGELSHDDTFKEKLGVGGYAKLLTNQTDTSRQECWFNLLFSSLCQGKNWG